MTDEQFEALVAKLGHAAKSDPAGYERKVLLLALLGNAYIVAILLLVAGLLLALIASVAYFKALALKLVFVVGAFLWVILKALWVRVDPPEGTKLRPEQAPELFAMVERLRQHLDAPPFDHVLVTDDFNAGVVQSPRFGVFGWPQNYLLIGLPLMKALSMDQFKAVLAHEFGHLAAGHGQMSNWVYRQRLRWSRLVATLEANDSSGSFLFKPFLKWFSPYFSAYSFPMARANEYVADATAVRLTSAKTAAEALTSVDVVGSYLNHRYWPQIHQRADEEPQPNFAPYFGLGQGLASELDCASAQTWTDEAMARKTDSADTHPALCDRLQAIGEPPRLALPDPQGTADRLLGGALTDITERFDRRWRERIRPSWEERYRSVQDARREFAELNARFAAGEELSQREAYDRARLTESVGKQAEEALAQFHALHERAPDDAPCCFALGARLLSRDHAEGCALIEKAMRLDQEATAQGCELLRDYHWRTGNKDEAHLWHQRLIERLQLQEAAAKERNQVLLKDEFVRHGLPEEEVARLRDELRKIPGLQKAYLVKKEVKHLAQTPCYVFGYKTSKWYQLHRKERALEVLRQIQECARFPGETLIISLEGDNYRFGRKFGWMRGTRIL